MEKFDPLRPFKDKKFYKEVYGAFKDFKFKLFGKIGFRLMGRPSSTEFDLNLGKIHFTEDDFRRLSKMIEDINKKWGTEITFCIFTKERTGRELLINVRSPMAPVDIL